MCVYLLADCRKLEVETNLSVHSSKVLQKQLEVQLESTMKQLRLMEQETSKAKSELLSLRDENLKFQRMIMDLETEKEKLSVSIQSIFEKSSNGNLFSQKINIVAFTLLG